MPVLHPGALPGVLRIGPDALDVAPALDDAPIAGRNEVSIAGTVRNPNWELEFFGVRPAHSFM